MIRQRLLIAVVGVYMTKAAQLKTTATVALAALAAALVSVLLAAHTPALATNTEHLKDLPGGPCERIDKKLDENRPLSREESRIHRSGFCNQGGDVITASASPVPIPSSGGPAILGPAAALLFGSGILTYAILRRR